MLHLTFAPSANELARLLLPLVRAAWSEPFEPPTVIVPSPAFGKWLRMQLAQGPQGLGCVANLPMPTLERYLWNTLGPDPEMRLLDVAHLQQAVCALLDEQLLKGAAYAPLRAYLDTGGGIDPLKRVQLAARIAAQFLEYEYNRPSVWGGNGWRRTGIDASWLDRRSYLGKDAAGEDWQSDLYRRAWRCFDRRDITEYGQAVRYISLPHLYRLRREQGLADGSRWRAAPGTVLLAGVSKVSHFHRNLLVEISQESGVEMHVLLTNPCAEFWEDVDTRRTRPPRRSWKHDSGADTAGVPARRPDDYDKTELAEFAHLPPDHPLLELWGNAGKENIFLWCQQAEWNFDYHCPAWADSDTGPATLLQALQYSLLRRERALPAREGGWGPDGTLQVLACPDPGREIEEIREQILDMVAAGTLARLNDAVVYMPDPAAYVPHIQRVFGAYHPGEPEYIPFCVLGAPGSDSVVAQAAGALLALLQGSFDRAHVFELLRNPVVQATRRIGPGRVAVWEQWAADLGIYRGYNRQHRERMGDRGQTRTDAHTFELGMARMLIGDLAAGPTALGFVLRQEGPAEPVDLPVHPYRDFATSDRQQLEQFCSTVEQLNADIEQVRAALAEGLAEGLDAFVDMVRGWLGEIPEGAVPDPSAEAGVLRDFLGALSHVRLQCTAAGRDTLPLEEFTALAAGCLPKELSVHAQAWTGGVTFAPLRPAMIVPHAVVFAAGLDAAAFPGSSDRPSWDLLSQRRIVGDPDRVRDNRFAFLELLHAARERLVLSFRARDMQREADLQPASVVLELETYLCEQGLRATGSDGKQYCTIRRTVPWIVRESLAEIAAGGRAHGSWDRTELQLAQLSAGPRVAHRHELAPLRSGAGPASQTLHTSLFDLRRFFANPLEYHLCRTLGIELDEEPGTLSATDEPLDSGALALSSLHKAVWAEVLRRIFPAAGGAAVRDKDELARIAGQTALREYARHAAAGGAPEAQFEVMEERSVVRWARQCVGPALALADTFADHALLENADLSLGRQECAGDLTVALPSGRECTVACRHSLALAPRPGREPGPVGIVSIKTDGTAAENPDLWLAGVVQWLAERGRERPLALRLVQLNRGNGRSGIGSSTVALKAATEKNHDIKEWFAALLDEMLVRRCSDHLPFAAVQKVFREEWGNVAADAVAEALEGDHPAYRCYLPAFELADARLPQVDDGELRRRARARFAPMLERWLHDE